MNKVKFLSCSYLNWYHLFEQICLNQVFYLFVVFLTTKESSKNNSLSRKKETNLCRKLPLCFRAKIKLGVLKIFNFYRATIIRKPLCRRSLQFANWHPYRDIPPHTQKGGPGYDIKMHLMVRFLFWWSGECRVPLHYLWLKVIESVRLPSIGHIDLFHKKSTMNVISKAWNNPRLVAIPLKSFTLFII